MNRRNDPDMPTKRKLSEMIAEIGAGFIGAGKTLEERQNRLNAVCTAWNIASGSPELRQQQLERYGEGYLRSNPATSPSDLANILKDLNTLMERKLQLFPDDHRQIVNAQVVEVGTGFRIEVASATLR
jgi:hypothetical protein